MDASAVANWTAALLSGKQALLGPTATGPQTETFAGLASLSLSSLLNALTSPTELLKIFLLGGFLETFRRLLWRFWGYLLSYLYLEATLEKNEPAYQWMLLWLAQHSAWRTSRSVLITQPMHGDPNNSQTHVQLVNAQNSKHDRPVELQPMFGTDCNLWYRGSWIRVHRNRGSDINSRMAMMLGQKTVPDSMQLRILFGGHRKLLSLLAEAKELYKHQITNRIRIWTSQPNVGWSSSIIRAKRGLTSVILDDGIKSMLLEDAKEFLRSEQWYADRGIPWRRGYLLHGCPGSGKTSLIHALAGELDLDIYVISLSQRGMDDSALNQLITNLPAKAIALIEDIDVAFTRGPERKQLVEAVPQFRDAFGSIRAGYMPPGVGTMSEGLTLAGLLGAIDGVAAQEGRILFATTNRYGALDAALKRPGRLDIHVEFKEASRAQAAGLFERFYPAEEEGVRNMEKPLIDLTAESTPDNEKSTLDSTDPSDSPITAVGLKEAPKLTESELSEMSARFASLLPEREFAMAAIQGHLMLYKVEPFRAIEEAGAFVNREREQKKKGEMSGEVEKGEQQVETPNEKGKEVVEGEKGGS